MPIKIPSNLPATRVLQEENIFVMDTKRAKSQNIRPLRILVLNLMPTKIVTETQIARLIGNTALQIEMELMTVNRPSHHTSMEHIITFYKTFPDVRDEYYDGMIITGAPVELMEFEDVDYWEELCEIMQWSRSHVYSTFHICWGAQAGLYFHYGVGKYPLPSKMFGIFPHRIVHKNAILFRGFDDVFFAPHSRHTDVNRSQIVSNPKLKILAESAEAGVYAVMTDAGRQIFVTGHPEYDLHTRGAEYHRDKELGLPISIPKHYFPNDDDTLQPLCTWRSSANLLFSNWLNYFVYQATPYDIGMMPPF